MHSYDCNSVVEFENCDKLEVSKGLANVVLFPDYFLIADTVEKSRKQIRCILNDVEKEHIREPFWRVQGFGIYTSRS